MILSIGKSAVEVHLFGFHLYILGIFHMSSAQGSFRSLPPGSLTKMIGFSGPKRRRPAVGPLFFFLPRRAREILSTPYKFPHEGTTGFSMPGRGMLLLVLSVKDSPWRDVSSPSSPCSPPLTISVRSHLADVL